MPRVRSKEMLKLNNMNKYENYMNSSISDKCQMIKLIASSALQIPGNHNRTVNYL